LRRMAGPIIRNLCCLLHIIVLELQVLSWVIPSSRYPPHCTLTPFLRWTCAKQPFILFYRK
jgi:hypothetical protein